MFSILLSFQNCTSFFSSMFPTARSICKVAFAKKILLPPVRCLSLIGESGVLKSTIPDLDIPEVSIPEYVFKDFHKFPNKTAVECAFTGRSYTYDDVLFKSNNFSRALRKQLKLLPGDVVACLLPNVPEYPICVFGCLLSKIIVTTINPAYTAEEIYKQIVDTDSKAIITLTKFHSIARDTTKLAKKNIPIIIVKTQETEGVPNGSINITDLFNSKIDCDDLPPAHSNDIAIIPYSSGTTGLPKGVPLSHKNIVSNTIQVSHPNFRLHIDTTGSHQDVVPAILPMFHIFGFTGLLCVMLSSLAKLVCMPTFSAEAFLKMALHCKPNTLLVVPSVLQLITHSPQFTKKNLQSVRTFLSGAAPLSSVDEEKLLDKFGHDKLVKQGYGLTETSPAIFMSSSRTVAAGSRGTVGEILPNTTVKLVSIDNPNKPVSAGQAGELLVKGPQVMRGYFNKSNKDEDFEDGYFKTGDSMRYDENMTFYVVDRLKDLIKVKGFQVAPAELENILRTHPSVLDAAVIGVPHSKYGEAPRAYVVLKPNHPVKPESIQEYVANKVVNYKHLKGGVSIIDSIPTNPSGKILRKELKSLYDSEKKTF